MELNILAARVHNFDYCNVGAVPAAVFNTLESVEALSNGRHGNRHY
jgi:hypothetical protein